MRPGYAYTRRGLLVPATCPEVYRLQGGISLLLVTSKGKHYSKNSATISISAVGNRVPQEL